MLPDSVLESSRLVSLFTWLALKTAMNTMATFVHNEPTSLSVLQELGLPQALYTQLEQEYASTHEVSPLRLTGR
jgi:E3 ubiquitin-protein ligase HUWE1